MWSHLQMLSILQLCFVLSLLTLQFLLLGPHEDLSAEMKREEVREGWQCRL